MSLTHPIRKKIYYLILKYPGIHFNELKRKGDFASGQLTHHLSTLEKKELISSKKGKVTNYYSKESEELNNNYTQILRDKRKRQIIQLILKQKLISSKNLKTELDLSPSTISWHLKDLELQNIIISKTAKKIKYYFLGEETRQNFKTQLKEEKKSIVSSLVDSFIEFFDEEL